MHSHACMHCSCLWQRDMNIIMTLIYVYGKRIKKQCDYTYVCMHGKTMYFFGLFSSIYCAPKIIPQQAQAAVCASGIGYSYSYSDTCSE